MPMELRKVFDDLSRDIHAPRRHCNRSIRAVGERSRWPIHRCQGREDDLRRRRGIDREEAGRVQTGLHTKWCYVRAWNQMRYQLSTHFFIQGCFVPPYPRIFLA